MITLLLHLLRILPFLFGGHRQLALENLALRQQLAVYKRTVPRPKLCTTDRLLWVGLAKSGPAGDKPSPSCRPTVDTELKTLITRMASANPLRGAPRIHGELMNLGFNVAERTFSRLMPRRAQRRRRRGARSLTTMYGTSSPSTSSPSPLQACDIRI